jgi:ABC-type antimicrobial peptide transport system ATPase subunit
LKQKIIALMEEPLKIKTFTSSEEKEEKRIRTLAARGLFNKVVRNDDIGVATRCDEVLARTKALFPLSPLPTLSTSI